MAALHPAETALRQATTAANQAVAERTALLHYDTSKVKVATITRQAGGQLVKWLSGWWEFDISVKLADSNISCHK